MANELAVEHLTGRTVYAVISNPAGQRWNTAAAAFQSHSDGNWVNYDIPAAEQGTSGRYLADMPGGITAPGRYYATFYEQVGGSPHITNDYKLASGDFEWSGSAEVLAEYPARVTLTRDSLNTRDEYTALWFRNVTPLTAGITSPTIQVIKQDGTDLIASTPMSTIGATGALKYHASGGQRMIVGDAYIVRLTATIDGATRSSQTTVTRDA